MTINTESNDDSCLKTETNFKTESNDDGRLNFLGINKNQTNLLGNDNGQPNPVLCADLNNSKKFRFSRGLTFLGNNNPNINLDDLKLSDNFGEKNLEILIQIIDIQEPKFDDDKNLRRHIRKIQMKGLKFYNEEKYIIAYFYLSKF